MKISYNWLKEFVDIDISPVQIKEILTSSGFKVENLSKIDSLNDTVLEIEITSNRPDLLSMIGIAREVSALMKKTLKLPQRTEDDLAPDAVLSPRGEGSHTKGRVKVDIESNKCKRYTARAIYDVKVSSSPKWLIDRITPLGLRPVNNVVDITNYCMMEYGQPLHGFDYDKIRGKKIIVRLAQKGEKLVTIDGVERALDEETLVICDTEGPVAIAGIMGGKDTEVTDATKNVLLESAYFDPVSIRRTTRRLGIASESSYRFERGVDLIGVSLASSRAASLMKRITGGKPTKGIVDKGKKDTVIKSIYLEIDRVNSLLGTRIKENEIIRILKALSFDVSKEKRRYLVTVPHHRQDIKSDVDLVEEVARLYGYDKIPKTLPKGELRPQDMDSSIKLFFAARTNLSALGLQEVLNYSLISYDLLQKTGHNGTGEIVRIENPLSNEQEIMRPTLLPGIMSAVSHNIKRNALNVKIYELGRVYMGGQENNFVEQRNLAIAITGERYNNWQMKSRAVDFFDLKGLTGLFLERMNIPYYDFISYGDSEACKAKDSGGLFREYEGLFNKTGSSVIVVQDKPLGIIGKVKDEVLARFDIHREVYAGEFKMDVLVHLSEACKAEVTGKRYREIPKYPHIRRDMAIVIDKGIQAQDVERCIRESGGDLINNVWLFDQYTGEQVPPGLRSLAFSIEYLARDRTLTDNEVKEVHARVLKAIEERFKATFR